MLSFKEKETDTLLVPLISICLLEMDIKQASQILQDSSRVSLSLP